ncbi:YaeQ family protein [Thiomicrorhabdus aquaedulcis]|uniref:YaeQ family protein n=1 Tax=Thiomicrorhabdus aquaedulcis TaxID=2211106 RepID=UPI000FDBF020|nr:YaeQ family protein [Thiomicrorhabdus aquaedulcis]
MALKPTIYKFKIAVSDLNRNRFDDVALTIAQHPSENLERMMVRVLAFCIHQAEFLTFTKGLNENDDPAIWARSLDDQIDVWIDVGEPAVDRLKKASYNAKQVFVYSFNSKSDVWWEQSRSKLALLKVNVLQVPWGQAQDLAKMVERTMDFSVTLTGESAYFATAQGDCEVHWNVLQIPQ